MKFMDLRILICRPDTKKVTAQRGDVILQPSAYRPLDKQMWLEPQQPSSRCYVRGDISQMPF